MSKEPSSRKHAEVQARLAAIVDSSDDAIVSKDLNGVITSWNHGAERLFGYSAAEAVGRPVTLLIPEERQNEEPEILDRIRRGERIEHYETVRQRKDGSPVAISLSVSPILDAHGKVIGASKIARDITDQKLSAARLALDQAVTLRLYELGKLCARPGDHFAENASQIVDAAVWMSNADRGALQLFDEVAGTLTIVAHRGFDEALLEQFRTRVRGQSSPGLAAIESGERIFIGDVATTPLLDTATKETLMASGVRAVQGTPLIDSKGVAIGILATHYPRPYTPTEREVRLLGLVARQATDYLERKRADDQREELLRAAQRSRSEAEAASRAKDEFLAMLSHELRNPLSAVRNAITAATLDETTRDRALEIARRQTDQLGRIVDDLLDVARITRGRVPLRRQRVSLAGILERTTDAARPLMEERGHTLEVRLPQEEIRLEIDPARIEQAIANLLANAAKYTDPGGSIVLSAERTGDDAVIRVRDTGIGIAPEMLPRVFELFAQADRTLDRARGGLGIGLTLVRRIVELHGGTIEATSAGPGTGSEFVVKLPARGAGTLETDAAAADMRARPEQPPARVLMVEDNPDAADSLVMILELLGHHVRVVRDGQAALDAARANPPDIALVDIGLPGMSGYDVAREVRRDPALKHLVLVALTGYGRPEDKAQALAAGFDYHMVKPIDLETLGNLVARVGSPARRLDTLH